MPVDFGILQNQQQMVPHTTQVVQVPNYNAQDMSALMSGLQSGQNMRMQNAELALKQQQMGILQKGEEREEAKFPGEMTLQSQQIAKGNVEQKSLNQSWSDQQAQREALKKSEQNLFNTLKQQGVEGLKTIDSIKQAKAQTEKMVLDNKKSLLDLSDTERAFKLKDLSSQGNLISQVFSYPKDQRAKIYENSIKPVIEATGSKPFLESWDDAKALGVVQTHYDLKDQIATNPYKSVDLAPEVAQTSTEQRLDKLKEMQFGITKTKVQAQYTANLPETTDALQQAKAATDIASTADRQEKLLTSMDTWNTQHPNDQINFDNTFKLSGTAKEKLATMGWKPKELAAMETIAQNHAEMVKQTFTSMQKVPRSSAIIDAIEAADPGPGNTVQSQLYAVKTAQFSRSYTTTYAEFMGDWDAQHNNDRTGMASAWARFSKNDPNISAGKMPDGEYYNKENYTPYLDRNFKPISPDNVPELKGLSSSDQQALIAKMIKEKQAGAQNGQ